MTEEEEIQLTIDVQAGMGTGDTVKYDNIADEAVGHIAGDVVFVIKQVPHEFFVREGSNLKMDFHITLLDSLVGFRKVFKHLDGHDVVVEKKDVSYCSEIMVVRNEGMPIRGQSRKRGDLYITLLIQFPQKFTESQKDLIRKAMA
jgi:DnaJ homolog subfamily B member 11